MTLRNSSFGFTLIELMVTVSVVAILTAIAVPNLRDFLVSSRLTSDVNTYVSLLNYARSEAIARNQRVIVCPKTAGADTCAAISTWNTNEIQVFVDVNGDGNRDAGDTPLKMLPILDAAGTQRVVTSSATTPIIFGSLGYSQTASSPFWLDIETVNANAAYVAKYGRRACISTPGRVTVAAKNATCAAL